MFGWVSSVRVFLFWPSSLCVINAVRYFIETLPIWFWVFSISIEEKSLILSVSAELDSLRHCQLLNLGGWELVWSPVPFPLIYLLLLDVYEWFACMHVCVPPVCLLDPLELGLQTVVSQPCGCWNWTHVLYKSNMYPQLLDHISRPSKI